MIDGSSLIAQDKRFFNEEIVNKQHGFICSDDDLELCVRLNRFMKLLVRCGNGRFVVPAQDASHFVKIINDSKADHVRDISLVSPNHVA
jgi:hypothetical protein